MIQPKSSQALIEVLTQSLHCVLASEDSIWSSMTVQEIGEEIESAIAQLQKGLGIKQAELTFLFLPTGPLQETALSNGWGDEYLRLANRFDNAIAIWQ